MVGPTWTAEYDAAGDMTCRAATGANSCAGNSPNGSPLTWDTEGRLVEWTSPTGAPWSSSIDLYDGEGNRVQQQTVSGGVTTQTYYVSNLEEVSVAGGVTTTTTYYYAGNGGPRIATATNGVFSYLASDTLGTAEVALDANGNTTAAQLYAPYGTTRYASGTMPGSYGYTGQRADAVTGLDYYGARYYDAAAGQFASADTVLPGKGYDVWGLSRYAYVAGNPITRSDPSGHHMAPLGDYFFAPIPIAVGIASAALAAGQGYVAARSVRAVVVVNRALKNKWKLSWRGNDPADVIADAADSPGTAAIKASARDSAALADAGEDLVRSSKWLGRLGKASIALLFVGGAIDGFTSYNLWEHDHPGDTGHALAYASIHAAATMIGGYVGATVGAVLGAGLATAACGGIPVCGVVGYYAGSFVGGVVGSAVGGMLVDAVANVNNPTTAAVANVATSVASNIGSAWNSVFG